MASNAYIPSLDGIRALSFTIVFVAHAGLGHVVPGGFGVTVFFFLSGYLITTLLRVEVEQRGRIDMGSFYLRRVLRILPPFYAILGLAVVLTATGVLPGRADADAVAALALHYANYFFIADGEQGAPAGTAVYWSLAVEEHFYLLFPWLLAATSRRGWSMPASARLLVVLCLLVLAWRCVLVHVLHAPAARSYMGSDTRVDSILWGCVLGLWGNPHLDRTGRVPARVWKHVLLPLAAAMLLATFLVRSPEFRETWRYSLQGVALVPFFVVAVREPQWGPFRLLNLRVVRWIGVLSYSLYLVHHVVIEALRSCATLAPLALGVASFVVSVAIAAIVNRAIEQPCARLRRRLSRGG